MTLADLPDFLRKEGKEIDVDPEEELMEERPIHENQTSMTKTDGEATSLQAQHAAKNWSHPTNLVKTATWTTCWTSL